MCTYMYLHEHEVFNTILPPIHNTVTTHCNALQHTATVLLTATHCNFPADLPVYNTAATHFNTLQRTATVLPTCPFTPLQPIHQQTRTLCSRPLAAQHPTTSTTHQHTNATHCNTLQHTVTHCNTLQPHPRHINTQTHRTATHKRTEQQHTNAPNISTQTYRTSAHKRTEYQHTNAPNINTQTHRISTEPVGPTDR